MKSLDLDNNHYDYGIHNNYLIIKIIQKGYLLFRRVIC